MNIMGFLQQFGRSLMLPTIVLPGAAVLLSLSSLPWDQWGVPEFASFLHTAATSIFAFLPYLFAFGVAMGLTSNASTAGLAAIIGLYTYSSIINLNNNLQPTVLTGVFIGLAASYLHEKYKGIQFPESIQFFGGPRFIPLVMMLLSASAGVVMLQIEPLLRDSLIELGELVSQQGGLAVFLFGILFRLLLVVGLHHVVSHIFYFQLGGYETTYNDYVFGDLARFFAGDPTAGIFMAGLFPTTMFAIPAIAFAMIHEAPKAKKPLVTKTLLSSALTSFLTGVTEPIEFAFLFAAPYLYLIHAFLSGCMMWLVYELGIRHGFAYSAGAIDFVVNAHLATKWWLLLPIGVAFGFVYYVLFRFAIRKYNIATPGREEGTSLNNWATDIPYRAPLILQALGGKDNIEHIEACITRLRLRVVNAKIIDRPTLKNLGAAGIISLGGGNVQVVFGTYSELIAEQIDLLCRRDQSKLHFIAPMQGKMIPLHEVPDTVFARKLVGDGVGFIPEIGEVVSPVQGKIIHIYPTRHAIGLQTVEGVDILLHIGMGSSELRGKGFETFVQVGDVVKQGQLLLKFDLSVLLEHEKSIISTMVITNTSIVDDWNFAPYKNIKIGKTPIMTIMIRTAEESNDGGDRR